MKLGVASEIAISEGVPSDLALPATCRSEREVVDKISAAQVQQSCVWQWERPVLLNGIFNVGILNCCPERAQNLAEINMLGAQWPVLLVSETNLVCYGKLLVIRISWGRIKYFYHRKFVTSKHTKIRKKINLLLARKFLYSGTLLIRSSLRRRPGCYVALSQFQPKSHWLPCITFPVICCLILRCILMWWSCKFSDAASLYVATSDRCIATSYQHIAVSNHSLQ